jgi:O-antigen/teichoic acid export membrane protein
MREAQRVVVKRIATKATAVAAAVAAVFAVAAAVAVAAVAVAAAVAAVAVAAVAAATVTPTLSKKMDMSARKREPSKGRARRRSFLEGTASVTMRTKSIEQS